MNEDCIAVDINPVNGFIALAVGVNVYIYKPIHQIMKNPKWTQCAKIYHDPSRVNCCKWGQDNELIVGSDYLSFWKINDEFGEYKPILLWNKRQPKPVYSVAITENSQLIASIGKYDLNVKLWERISISGDQVIFNLTLLPHPKPVTTIRWKRGVSTDSIVDSLQPQKSSASQMSSMTDSPSNTLYTLCEDKTLRIWLCFGSEQTQMTIQHWGDLKLKDDQKYCIIIDNCILQSVFNGQSNDKTGFNRRNFDYFIEKKPDIVMFGSNDGKFDVFALEHLSSNPPKRLVKKQLLTRHMKHPIFFNDPKFLYFSELQHYDESNTEVSMAIHDLQGVIRHSLISLANFLDQTNKKSFSEDMFIHLEHKFTGHNKSIRKLERSSDGEALLTISRFSENSIWIPQEINRNGSTTLRLKTLIKTESPIKLAVVHERGNLVICFLENNKLQAWDCSSQINDKMRRSTLRATFEFNLLEKIDTNNENDEINPILMLNIPENVHNHDRHFVTIVYSNNTIRCFEISCKTGIREIQSNFFDVRETTDEVQHITAIDPVHSTYFSDRPLIAMITKHGFVRVMKATVDHHKGFITWKCSAKLNTGIENAKLIKGSSTGKLCIVDNDASKITFWDVNRSVLEYEKTFDDEIKDIDWTSTKLGQSIVSIGFTNYSLLYTQIRYDYTNHVPTYLPMEKIDITSHTAHTIGDSIWMKDGNFVVASGNQLYIKDKSLILDDPFTHSSIGSRKILSNDILHLNSVLNGPLPVYHPQFLVQAIYANKIELVKELLVRLFLELRKIDFESKNVITDLPSDLNIQTYKFLVEGNQKYPIETFPDPYPTFNKVVSMELTEQLTKIALPYLTRHQQVTLMTVVEAMEQITRYKSMLDHSAIKFLLGVKLFLSHKNVQKSLTIRDASWALHSDNKTLLLSLFESHIINWNDARNYKIAYWVKQNHLVEKFEKIAKFEFSKDGSKDPSRCSLFYLALKKKQVLLSLWRISIGHPEQQKMMKFISNDFTQPRWRTAALKNAFVLMSKHRYSDAATFFLLANSLKDSVNVIFKQMDDIDLAIAVCRVYEGDNGPVLGEFLTRQLLPKAILESDKWTTSFIYWKLRKQDVSIKALVTTPIDLENNDKIVSREKLVNKTFLIEDPALLVLYKSLRTRNINYFTGSLELGLKIEYTLLLRSVDILRRMGCDFLAASLVKNWVFIDKPKNISKSPIKFDQIETMKINTLISEPTTTVKVRRSLFDKFETEPISKASENASKMGNASMNLLDNFVVSSDTLKSNKSPKSMLDEFKMDTDFTNTKTVSNKENKQVNTRNLLEEYGIDTNPKPKPPKNILDDFGSMNQNITKNSANNCPKNILDEFGSASVNNNKKTVKKTSKKPVKKLNTAPRNLLDDFM